MIKIGITVRNRLGMTKKTIEALKKHSTVPHQLYIFDNMTNYKLENHFALYYGLLNDGHIHQITFNTKESTFDAFSKAVALNQFGRLHEEDPKKDECNFLLFIDNDIIVTPDWDQILLKAWKQINKLSKQHPELKNVKVIGQAPGGIKHGAKLDFQVAGYDAIFGQFGGSAFWSVRPNFYNDVGFLDLKQLVGLSKQHDQKYWRKLSESVKGGKYILGLKHKLCIHCGSLAGSICNTIGRGTVDKKKLEQIKFQEQDKAIDNMTFDEFYNKIINNKKMINNW